MPRLTFQAGTQQAIVDQAREDMRFPTLVYEGPFDQILASLLLDHPV
jgi:hypothetical protein